MPDFKKALEKFFNTEQTPLYTKGTVFKAREKFISETLAGKDDMIDVKIFNLLKENMKSPDQKIFDDGCGLGGILKLCEENNFNAIGIDNDPYSINVAKARLKNPDIASLGDSHKLPYANDGFDLIVSKTVIEHVTNPQIYLNEVFRVLKKGGKFILFAPNYRFPWEGHYHTFWLPWIAPYVRPLLKIFLKLQGKNPCQMDYVVTFTTSGQIKNWLKTSGFTNLNDLSIKDFIYRMQNPELISYSAWAKIANLIKGLLKIKSLKNLLAGFLMITKLYHPIIIIAEK